MYYYKRHIGDYSKKCGRLSMLQHGAYTLLLDACYDREKFPTLDEAIDWTWASTEAEIDAVKFVLSRFFKITDDGEYVQDRILEELLHYAKNAETNKRIAIERETKRKLKSTNREQTVNEPPPNQEPLTKNQEPLTKKQETLHDGFDEFWSAYPRKDNKASAKKAWKKSKPDLQIVLKALAWQSKQEGWLKEKGKFVPMAATYLNQERYLDDNPTDKPFNMGDFMREIGAIPS